MVQAKSSLRYWVGEVLGQRQPELASLYGDASRRHYYRVLDGAQSWIVMDSSAELTEVLPFMELAKTLQQQNLPVPMIVAAAPNAGYLMLEDFGDTTLLSILQPENVAHYYAQALAMIVQMQQITKSQCCPIIAYDQDAYHREFSIFTDWYLHRYRRVNIMPLQNLLTETFAYILQQLSEQPRVFVHRDFHSRNLMVRADDRFGLLDFQGAKWGPMTYDLVSLLRDCYIDWSTEQVSAWVEQMHTQLWSMRSEPPASAATFQRWFDITGLQRHLKVLGQFARKALNENNQRYLADMPRVQNYVYQVCERYPELASFYELLKQVS